MMRGYLADFLLLCVVVDDRLREVMESLETLHNRLLVVVDATTGLSTLQQPRLHRLVFHLQQHISHSNQSSTCARRT